MDAAPQSHVKSTKKEYPTKRKVMGYPTLPAALLDSTRPPKKGQVGRSAAANIGMYAESILWAI
jgi:hypothetical protein